MQYICELLEQKAERLTNDLLQLECCLIEIDNNIKDEMISKILGQIREVSNGASSLTFLIASLVSHLHMINDTLLEYERALDEFSE